LFGEAFFEVEGLGYLEAASFLFGEAFFEAEGLGCLRVIRVKARGVLYVTALPGEKEEPFLR